MATGATDWFAQNAPKTPPPSSSGGDWFAQNAPSASTRPTEAQQAASAPSLKPVLPSMDYEGAPSGGAGNARSGIPAPPPAMRPANESMGQDFTREVLAHPAAPYIAGGVASALLGPEAGIPAATAISALGGAGEEATKQIAQHVFTPEEAPKSSGSAAMKIGAAGAKAGAAELGGQVVSKVGGAVVRKVTDPLAEGIQQVFKASGPPSDPAFRDSLVTAQHDLKNIIDANPITDSRRGGIINTDFRLRDFRDALKSYMSNMYSTERASQISMASSANAQGLVKGVNPDVLQFTAKKLSKELPLDSPARGIADRLSLDPAQPLSIADMDQLQLATSAELRKYAAGSPQQQAAARTTSKVTAGYKSMNDGLKSTMDDLLQSANQPGLESYNKRYAALADVQDAISKRMNSSEAIKLIDNLHEYLTPHGLGARVSTALGNSPGRNLEKGLKNISAGAKGAPPVAGARPYAPPSQPIAGLLPPPAPTLAPAADTSGPVSLPVPRTYTATEQAAGRAAAAGPSSKPIQGPIPEPPPNISTTLPTPPGFSPVRPPTPGDAGFNSTARQSPEARNLWNRPVPTGDTSTTPGGMPPALQPPSGLVKQEFAKVGVSDLVTPRQSTTLETLMRGPRWKDMDRADRQAAIREILGRK